jgi:hypothetical protein
MIATVAAGLDAARKHVDVARDLGMIDSGDRRSARIDPGSDYDLVEAFYTLLIRAVSQEDSDVQAA